MVVSFILLVGEHHEDGVSHILGTVDNPPDDVGHPSSCWWVTKFWMVGDPPGDGG